VPLPHTQLAPRDERCAATSVTRSEFVRAAGEARIHGQEPSEARAEPEETDGILVGVSHAPEVERLMGGTVFRCETCGVTAGSKRELLRDHDE
jgi:hypothetical protein